MGIWGLHYLLDRSRGELHLFYTADAKTAGKGFYEMRFDIYHVGSANGRKSWKAPVFVRKGYHGSMLSAIELKSGRLILPICYLTPRVWSNRGKGFDAFTDMGRFSSGVVYSDDGGIPGSSPPSSSKSVAVHRRRWNHSAHRAGAEGRTRMALVADTVWPLLRVLFSGRRVWTKPTPTSILSSDSPPSLTRLKDGRIVMFWNNCLRFSYAQGGRHVLHAAISEDDGDTGAATGKWRKSVRR